MFYKRRIFSTMNVSKVITIPAMTYAPNVRKGVKNVAPESALNVSRVITI
jgi:hypothetical protein